MIFRWTGPDCLNYLPPKEIVMVFELLIELGAALLENIGEIIAGAVEMVAENAGTIALGAGVTAATLAGTYIVVDYGLKYKTNKGLHEHMAEYYFAFSDRIQTWLRNNSCPRGIKAVILKVIEVGDNAASRAKRYAKKLQAVAVDSNGHQVNVAEEFCDVNSLPPEIREQFNTENSGVMLYELAT